MHTSLTANNLVETTKKVNTKLITNTQNKTNKKRIAALALTGITLILISVFSLLRIPYVGEFLDGFIFDLLLFGTAKYLFYLLLIVAGCVCFVVNKQYWRILITNRFFLITSIVMAFASLAFAISHYFLNWDPETSTVGNYIGKYFEDWKNNFWVQGKFVWEMKSKYEYFNGGIFWTLLTGINAGAPALFLFVILFVLLVIIILYICVKCKVKRVEYLRKKAIVWLGGFYQKRIAPVSQDSINLAKSEPEPVVSIVQTNQNALVPVKKNIDNSLQQAKEPDDMSDSYRTKPFTLKYAEPKRTRVSYNFMGKSVDNSTRNYEFAKQVSLDLTDFFYRNQIEGNPVKFHSGPNMINIWWELKYADDVRKLSKFKNQISDILNVEHFDVYLKNQRLIEFQFPVPNQNKINFSKIYGEMKSLPNQLKVAIGWNNACEPWTLNLASYKSILVAGSIGTGKGMLISSILLSLITRYTPADILLAIADTRSGHLSRFDGIPHLVSEIPNSVDAAFVLFDQISVELKYRVNLMSKAGVKTIDEYNKLHSTQNRIKPFIIVINDVQDLLSRNYEYVMKFLRTVNAYASVLNCHMIVVSSSISSELIDQDNLDYNYDLVFGFKDDEIDRTLPQTIINPITRLSGNGDFVLFDKFRNDANVITKGLACYVDSTELNHVINQLQDQNY